MLKALSTALWVALLSVSAALAQAPGVPKGGGMNPPSPGGVPEFDGTAAFAAVALLFCVVAVLRYRHNRR